MCVKWDGTLEFTTGQFLSSSDYGLFVTCDFLVIFFLQHSGVLSGSVPFLCTNRPGAGREFPRFAWPSGEARREVRRLKEQPPDKLSGASAKLAVRACQLTDKDKRGSRSGYRPLEYPSRVTELKLVTITVESVILPDVITGITSGKHSYITKLLPVDTVGQQVRRFHLSAYTVACAG